MTHAFVVVGEIQYHGHTVLGVFSTREKAEEYAESRPDERIFDGGWTVIECNLDEPIDWRANA